MVLTVAVKGRTASEIAERLRAEPDPPVIQRVRVEPDGTRRITFEEPLREDIVAKLKELGCAPD